MAMTPEEKKAYNREYYQQYKKKGKKKGRKKGSKKKTSTKKTNLVGLSNSGLNDSGKMQWALTKEKLSKEMNDALSKATTQEEKDKIRSEYQNKALGELQKIKSDPAMAKEKKASTKSSTKSSSSKSSSGSSSKSSSSKSSSSESTATSEAVQQIKDYIDSIQEKLTGGGISQMTEEQKVKAREYIQSTIDTIREWISKRQNG